MNYKRIYNELIENRKNNPLLTTQNTHLHHIIPKCCGGNNETNNLIRLTYREHYIAHLLLPKIYKHGDKHFKLMCAVQRMGNAPTHNMYRFNSRLYEKYVKERNRLVGEYSKQFMHGRTIYKNIQTGEIKILYTDSEEVKSGKWIGVRKGVKDPTSSERRKNFVAAIDKNGNHVLITKKEFDINKDKYVGINKGKSGLFDKLNTALSNRKWFEKIMYTDVKCLHIKQTSLRLFNLDFLQKIYYYVVNSHKAKKRLSWEYIASLCNEYNCPMGKPLYRLISKMKHENWNPLDDSVFVAGCNRYNSLLKEYNNEN